MTPGDAQARPAPPLADGPPHSGDAAPLPGRARLPWGIGQRAGYALYQAALHLALPLLLLRLRQRAKAEPLYGEGLDQRFGALPRGPAGAIWIFAASLGETRAVTPLARELIARGHRVVMTHSAPAGLTEGRRQFADEIAAGQLVQAYQPADLHWALSRAFRRLRPALVLVVEAEIWPGFTAVADRFGVPVVKVNANLTERALSRDLGRALGRLRLFFFRGLTLVLTKTPAHVERYARAGVDPARIRLVGELKFDLPLREDQIARAAELRPRLAGGRRVFMIASSIEGEEEGLIAALDRMRAELGAAPFVVWAPRSPQRFDAVAGMLAAAGYRVARRSEVLGPDLRPTAPLPDCDILLGDSLGEMDFYYALSDLVFVGATLVHMGGHNVNEPLALEKPVITGPSTYGIPVPAEEAQERGAMLVYPDAAALAEGLCGIFGTAGRLEELAALTRGLTGRHKGAARRSADLLAGLLTGPGQ